MKYLVNNILSFLCFFSLNTFGQESKVVAGPMTSFIDYYGTEIWFLLKSDAENIEIDIRDYQSNKLIEYDFQVNHKNQFKSYTPFTILLDKLSPNKEYIASIFVDGVFEKEIDIFTKRPHLDDVQFLIGYNTGESSKNLFSNMMKTNSDFMVWLGGHVDFNTSISYDSRMENYIKTRKIKYINDFMSSIPQIATWNELDYGVDNEGDFQFLRDTAYFTFDLFWPNSVRKTYNYTYYDYGTYQRYTYNDVDIFLLDAKTFNSSNSLYGNKQLDRLFQEIDNTGSTFTIIASPSSFTFETESSYLNYPSFKYFIEKIEISRPEGLIFISTGADNGTKLNTLSFQEDVNKPSYNYITEFNISSLEKNNYS